MYVLTYTYVYCRYLCCIITGHRISEQIQATDFKVRMYVHTYVRTYDILRYIRSLCIKITKDLRTHIEAHKTTYIRAYIYLK